MRVPLVCLTLLVVTLMSAFAASPFQIQKTALVTVIAEAGGPVASLTADDFVVREDRAMRQVVAAEWVVEPIFVTLLVDTVGPPMGGPEAWRPDGRAGLSQTQDLRRALTSFVTTSTSASSSNREDVLNVVTRASGGMRLTAIEATGLESMLKSVANSLLSQYTVTFTRPANAEVKSTQMETSKGGKVLLTPWMR